jgi:hypothetical protein
MPPFQLPFKEVSMKTVLWIAGILAVIWAVLWLGLKIASFAVHLLLIAALVLVVWWGVKRAL